MILRIVLLIAFISIISVWSENDLELQRKRRYIIFPSGASYKLVIGVAIPLNLPKFYSLGFVLNMQFIHSQLSNISQIAGGYPPTIPIERRRRETGSQQNDRSFTYMAVESLMDNREAAINGDSSSAKVFTSFVGHDPTTDPSGSKVPGVVNISFNQLKLCSSHGINGRECLLRTICDNAMHNLEHPANGLYGQLLNIILTPEYDHEDEASYVDDEYLDARRAGEYGVDCVSLYPDCPLGDGVLDMISVLE